MLRKILFISVASLTLAACASPVLRQVEPIARPAPVDLMQPCTEPPVLQSPRLGALMETYIETVGLYRECRAQQQALADWVQAGMETENE